MMRDKLDPKGLIGDSYRIDGIGAPECRMIFLDWAISLPSGVAVPPLIQGLLARHAPAAPDHPMTGVLRDGLGRAREQGRRGGWRGRRRPSEAAEGPSEGAADQAAGGAPEGET